MLQQTSAARFSETDLIDERIQSQLGPNSLICFSHLRWDFVFQRPQHLMVRFATVMPIHFWEESMVGGDLSPRLNVRMCQATGVTVVTPQLPDGCDQVVELRTLLDGYTATLSEAGLLRWYYTPMMLPFSRHLNSVCTIYDCMDELSNFRFAPSELVDLEAELFAEADVVFTGGYSLYEAKRHLHRNVHPFPSSVDKAHFETARSETIVPEEYSAMKGPRLGFYGVIDERMNLTLLAQLAAAKPDWHIIMLGPLAKISAADLPCAPNLHFLGGRSYADLPMHLAQWDVAIMPFEISEATRFISPTKTPEYLAGGKPVVSTPIRDVIRHYGMIEGVFISEANAFVQSCEDALALAQSGSGWLSGADAALAGLSWDRTAHDMLKLVANAIGAGPTRTIVRRVPELAESALRKLQKSGKRFDYLVVGAGFAGAVLAERLATQLNKTVLVIDKRSHIAGNAFDFHDASGVLVHKYGPHIFHTNSADVFGYLSQFTAWRPYEHRVRAVVDNKRVPIPINRTTLNTLYDLNLTTDEEAASYLASKAEPVETIRTSEDVVINAVGRDLYAKFFRDYTRKQWGLDASELDKSVTARVPTRTSVDDRYFQDKFQSMPRDGYTRMFEQMLQDDRITVALGVNFADVRDLNLHGQLIFTGPIDEFFDHRFGKLPYRSLKFRHLTLDREHFQEVGTVNFPDSETPYTRVSEYKHMTGQVHRRTTVTYEYPAAEGDPYYPIPRPENQAIYKKYEELALEQSDVVFCGRLATYRYFNMDQVVGQALATFRRIANGPRQQAGVTTPLFSSVKIGQTLTSAAIASIPPIGN